MTNADAHLLQLFLAVHVHPNNVLASFDVSNAFVNAVLLEDVIILTQTAPELIQVGLAKAGTLYQCTKACYSLQEASELWEETRDKTLKRVSPSEFVGCCDSTEDRQASCFRLPDDSDLPDISVFGEHEHVAAFLAYKDDFLPTGPRPLLHCSHSY